jgi:hypothetical protein
LSGWKQKSKKPARRETAGFFVGPIVRQDYEARAAAITVRAVCALEWI